MKRFLIALALLFAGPAYAQQQGVFRQITGYTVTYTTTAGTASQAIGSQTRVVRIMCTTDCLVAFPVTPIAAAATRPIFMPATRVEYFKVTPGAYVYGVRVSANGTIYVTEVE